MSVSPPTHTHTHTRARTRYMHAQQPQEPMMRSRVCAQSRWPPHPARTSMVLYALPRPPTGHAAWNAQPSAIAVARARKCAVRGGGTTVHARAEPSARRASTVCITVGRVSRRWPSYYQEDEEDEDDEKDDDEFSPPFVSCARAGWPWRVPRARRHPCPHAPPRCRPQRRRTL